MRKVIAFTLALALAGCTSSTPYGKCVGMNGKEDPKLEYEYSGWNIGVGIVCIEMVIPPIMVALNQLKCPVGPKVPAPTSQDGDK